MKKTLFKTSLIALIFLGVVSCEKNNIQKGEFTIKLENGRDFSSQIDEVQISISSPKGESILQKIPYNNGVLKMKLPSTIEDSKLVIVGEALEELNEMPSLKVSNKEAKMGTLKFEFYKDGKKLAKEMEIISQTDNQSDITTGIRVFNYAYTDRDVSITASNPMPKIEINLNLKKGYNLVSMREGAASMTMTSYDSAKGMKFILFVNSK